MALTAQLEFGNNATGIYSSKYNVADFRCHFVRSDNEARPDGTARCDYFDLTLPVPDKSDLSLQEWFINRSFLCGRVHVELSATAKEGAVQYRDFLFENAVCFSIEEEYHIDKDALRSMRLLIAPESLKIAGVSF